MLKASWRREPASSQHTQQAQAWGGPVPPPPSRRQLRPGAGRRPPPSGPTNLTRSVMQEPTTTTAAASPRPGLQGSPDAAMAPQKLGPTWRLTFDLRPLPVPVARDVAPTPRNARPPTRVAEAAPPTAGPQSSPGRDGFLARPVAADPPRRQGTRAARPLRDALLGLGGSAHVARFQWRRWAGRGGTSRGRARIQPAARAQVGASVGGALGSPVPLT